MWRFPPTKRMSTYITAIVAGEYHGEFDTYEGKFGTIPLGHYCRQSLKEHMDTAELVMTALVGAGSPGPTGQATGPEAVE